VVYFGVCYISKYLLPFLTGGPEIPGVKPRPILEFTGFKYGQKYPGHRPRITPVNDRPPLFNNLLAPLFLESRISNSFLLLHNLENYQREKNGGKDSLPLASWLLRGGLSRTEVTPREMDLTHDDPFSTALQRLQQLQVRQASNGLPP
jgi:hypothetical protein